MTTNINKIPDSDIISNRIFEITGLQGLEKDLVRNILNDWNEEWIDYIAENETGMTDNVDKARKRDNEKRLKDRIEKIGRNDKPIEPLITFDNLGF